MLFRIRLSKSREKKGKEGKEEEEGKEGRGREESQVDGFRRCDTFDCRLFGLGPLHPT